MEEQGGVIKPNTSSSSFFFHETRNIFLLVVYCVEQIFLKRKLSHSPKIFSRHGAENPLKSLILLKLPPA